MATNPTLPYATINLTVAPGTAFYNQVRVALAVAGLNALATGDLASINAYCLSPSSDVITRVALRIIAGMASAVPSDSVVQAAVTALVPTSGAFSL